jgi:hypothetical protein
MDTGQSGTTGVVQLERAATRSTTAASEFGISDQFFIQDMERLKELRSFLFEQAVCPADQSALKFGQLNLLRFDRDGRMPTEQEWAVVETLTQTLFSLLTPSLRHKFLMGKIPQWITWLAIGFAIIAVLSLIASIVSLGILTGLQKLVDPKATELAAVPVVVVPLYIFWLLALGAIGSIAFVGMNALSVQEDATFDLTNNRLMCLRIALGALFGLVLALPFGFRDFIVFCFALLNGTSSVSLSSQAVMLLLPFVLGFSTSLVIMILNRFVEAVQTFFGKVSASPVATAAPGKQ